MTNASDQNCNRDFSKTQISFFSIVIPVWNRAKVISRCLDSVFQQTFNDYEVVVVDDGSTDNTMEVISRYNDVRLRILQHVENKGVCAARHTGTTAAKGKWIVSLDSDGALLPGALEILAKMGNSAPIEVGVIGGCTKTDKGQVNPIPKPPVGFFGYKDYLKWLNVLRVSDWQPCRRREVFATVSWPTDRRLESQFHLRVARQWNYWICSDVIALTYSDADNRLTTSKSKESIYKRLEVAPYMAKDHEEILLEFSEDLKSYAPARYQRFIIFTALYNFQAGNKLRGLKYTIIAILRKPWRLEMYGLILLGMVAPPAFLIRVCRSRYTQWTYKWINLIVNG